MTDLTRRATRQLAGLLVIMAATLFVAAGTVRYWQAWIYLLVLGGAGLAGIVMLARNDPQLLARRTKGGPGAEGTPTQKIIMSLASAGFTVLLVVPALDRRYGWSAMPPPVALLGDALFVVSQLAILAVFKANTFAAATVTVEPGQRVIATGPYATIRHPMYAAGLLLLAASPVALGSWWGLAVMVPLLPVLLWRLLDEEAFLRKNLDGYTAYCERVPYRLVPFVW